MLFTLIPLLITIIIPLGVGYSIFEFSNTPQDFISYDDF